MKKVQLDKKYENRELEILKELKEHPHHPNIVRAKHDFITESERDKNKEQEKE